MYPMTPAKVNAATITMANMAAPPGGSFLSVLDTPKKEWSIPLSPDSGSLFLPGAPEALAKRRSAAAKCFSNSMATDNPSRFRTCAPALVVFGNRYAPRIALLRSNRSGGDQETPTSCFVVPLGCSNSAERWAGHDARRSFSNSA